MRSITPDQPREKNAESAGFKAELVRSLEPLRESLAQLLRELGSPSTARVLQNLLGIPYVGCWQVFRIVRANDPLTEARNAPSPGMLKGLLFAARANGAQDETATAVAKAAENFHDFVTRHAGDRSTFNLMVAEASESGQAETVVLQRRQAAYRAMSQLWGVQTDLQCITTLLGPPASDSDPYSKVVLSLQRGVRRLRADAQLTIIGFNPNMPGQSPANAAVPLVAEAAAQFGMPILPQFSTSPLPTKIEQVDLPTGFRLFNMVGGDVGRKSSVEFAVGAQMTDIPAEFDSAGRPIYNNGFIVNRKPIALLVMDLLVHRASKPGIQPMSIIHHHQEGDFTLATAERSQRFPGEDKAMFANRADKLDLIEAPALR